VTCDTFKNVHSAKVPVTCDCAPLLYLARDFAKSRTSLKRNARQSVRQKWRQHGRQHISLISQQPWRLATADGAAIYSPRLGTHNKTACAENGQLLGEICRNVVNLKSLDVIQVLSSCSLSPCHRRQPGRLRVCIYIYMGSY
jgi:hypothetical protein